MTTTISLGGFLFALQGLVLLRKPFVEWRRINPIMYSNMQQYLKAYIVVLHYIIVS